jgi:hypothetical protein
MAIGRWAIGTWPEDRASRVLLRTYGGKSQGEMLGAYQRDAELLLIQGYEPASQLYVEGSYSYWYRVLAVLLIVVGIGLLLVASMLLNPRPGTLVVTYVHRAPAQ